jgi:hypothetical protein
MVLALLILSKLKRLWRQKLLKLLLASDCLRGEQSNFWAGRSILNIRRMAESFFPAPSIMFIDS